MIIFQKKIDTYLYNFNLFIYICMYLHKKIYVCVCPVGGYFIHQIFVYPNIITFFSFLNHTTLNNWQVHMKYSTLLFWNLKLTFYGPKSHEKEEYNFYKIHHSVFTRKSNSKTEDRNYDLQTIRKKNQFIHKRDHKETSDICLNFQPLLFTLSLCLLHTHNHRLRWLATK